MQLQYRGHFLSRTIAPTGGPAYSEVGVFYDVTLCTQCLAGAFDTGVGADGIPQVSSRWSRPSIIYAADGSTKTNSDGSDRAMYTFNVSDGLEKQPEIYGTPTGLNTESTRAVMEYCAVCGRRLSWIRRRLSLGCCWRRECWQEFDETRS
jgi:hypothetical protein